VCHFPPELHGVHIVRDFSLICCDVKLHEPVSVSVNSCCMQSVLLKDSPIQQIVTALVETRSSLLDPWIEDWW